MADNVIQQVHSMPGRVRIRIPRLRKDPELAEAIADRLSALPAMEHVEVRPFTGSVRCTFAPDQVEVADICQTAAEAVEAQQVLGPESELPKEGTEYETGPSRVAVALAEMMTSIDRDIMRTTRGRFDMGAVASLGFLTAGLMEVMKAKKVPAPPWFNLAWWSLRTFMTSEQDAIQEAVVPVPVPLPVPVPEESRERRLH